MCNLLLKVKPRIAIGAVAILVILYVIYLYMSLRVSMTTLVTVNEERKVPKPLIAAWTTYFGSAIFPKKELLNLGCIKNKCLFTANRYYGETADAIVFHWRDIEEHEIPHTKPRYQKWVLLNYESPYHTSMSLLSGFHNRLDWTVSYRHDSDFVSPYGSFRKRLDYDPPPAILSPEQFDKKRPVSWMVSNCYTASQREQLAIELQVYLQVDIYGDCGGEFESSWGPRPGNRDEAYLFLGERYKFYLSFENSLCTDYATEKVFQALKVGMVPVVFGKANYTNILPPNSFVDISDYVPLSRLAGHLIKLTQNYTLYSEYLEWQNDFVIDQAEPNIKFVCQLCEKLREGRDKRINSEQTRDLSLWWDKSRDCS